MKRSVRKSFLFPLFGALLTIASGAHGQLVTADALPAELRGVTVTERLETTIPLDAEFTDENGNKVRLEDYFKSGRPVLLTLNYFECPMLCGLQLNGFLASLRRLAWMPGNQYEILTVSFDPTETHKMARLKKQNYVVEFGRPEAETGWAFLTGEKESIDRLTEAVGFSYRWDDESNQYIHPALAVVLTPEGKISRYLYGIEFDPQTLRLSMLEAAEGKSASTLDQILLFCFHYDPAKGSYALAAAKFMRFGGFLTLIALVWILVKFWRFELRSVSGERRRLTT